MKESTAIRLRKALTSRNMKQIELSEKAHIGKSAISQYLAGKVVPKQDKIYLLANALNVSEAWLMGHDEPMERKKNNIETIAAHRTDDPTKDLPEEARQSIEDFKKFIFEKHGIKYD